MQNKLRALALSSVLAFTSLPMPAHAADTVAWDIVEGLTTEVGPRLAGTDAEARARAWAENRLTALGFSKVMTEPYVMPAWVRGVEAARITAPFAHDLAITALGNSASTGEKGIEGEMVYFASLDALRAAPAGSLAGKIAFIDHAMRPTMDGSGYGPFGNVRRDGPSLAAQKGAVAVVIRSAGTDWHRNPHTGVTDFAKGVTPIPAGAVSLPDADLVARIFRRGKPVRITLNLTGRAVGNRPSGNVIAELPGRDPALPPILLGCHLDSWDLGTGAIDDASGCAIITAAALRAQQGGKALRTIRLLWAGGEELGGFGGEAYGKRHAREPHALAMESDFGADKVWRVQFNFAPASKALGERITAALWPMGIVHSTGKPESGTDVEPIVTRQKLAVVELSQDGTRYFDLHHTPDDTLDKIDPVALEQNVAAWTAVLAIVANEPGPIVAQ
jgi:hypothetical protein